MLTECRIYAMCVNAAFIPKFFSKTSDIGIE